MATKNEAAPKAKKSKKRQEKEHGKWIDRISEVTQDSRPYSIKSNFILNDLVDHPKFGAGVVAELLTDTTMKVVFSDGERTLVYNK